MNKSTRSHLLSAFLLLPAAMSLSALPAGVLAQPAGVEVRSLEVASDAGFEPGAQLTFTVTGTSRATGDVRVRGLRENIVLRETTARGVYVGHYTVKRSDRIEPEAQVRATLRSGTHSAAINYVLGDAMAPRRVAAPPAALPAPPPPPPAAPPPPRIPDPHIERFGISPLQRVEPGAEIRFVLEGTAGGTVIVDLPGVASDLRLREVRPGSYEGSYTIRRSDNFNPTRPVVATLRVGERVSTTNVPFPSGFPGADNRPPSVVNLVPREGDSVPGGPQTHISATFEDRGGSGIDPLSVQVIVSGRNVTRDADINPQSFSYRGPLPPGRHTVEVTARDRAGNVARKSWSFDVVAAVAANLPIEVLNRSSNELVGNGPTVIRARTGPNATVAATVHAVAPVGSVLSFSQLLFSQTLQADAGGNFALTFQPQIAVPGTRYDVALISTRANVRHESHFSLFQR